MVKWKRLEGCNSDGVVEEPREKVFRKTQAIHCFLSSNGPGGSILT